MIDLNFAPPTNQQEVHETMKVMTDSIMELRQIVQNFDPMAQAMLELTDRVKK